jgi:cytidyltransferase-like protein
MKKVVIVTGGFDPIHSGHIAYLREAAKLGDELIVGLNSDAWLTRKKGAPFMDWKERWSILHELWMTTDVIDFDDSDGSAIDAIRKVKEQWPEHQVVFANGGDRTKDNIPEMVFDDVEFVFGVGGENKANSSSWILQEWKAPKTVRNWGYYRVLHEVPGMKVKELTVEPGQSLSMQRHDHRAEYWIVSHGACIVNSMMPGGYALPPTLLKEHLEYKIPVGEWHQLTNPYEVPCKIVEIQYGAKCIEEDIERLSIDK